MTFETTLSEEDQEFAKKDLGEYKGARDTALMILKDKIALEPGLKANLDDAFLIRFLRVRKYDIDRAMALVKSYYAGKNHELLKDLRPSTVLGVVNDCVSCPMPTYNPIDNTKILVFRPGLWKAGDEKFSFRDMLRCHVMVLEYVLREERTQVRGFRAVIDGSGVGWEHAKELAKGLPQQIFKIQQDAMPLRIKGLHYINEPSMMGYIFNLIKPFMKEKLIKRLHFHAGDLSALHQFIDPVALPEHLGGKLPPLPHQEFIQDFINSEDYYVEMAKYYLDDPKALFKREGGDAQDSGVSGTYRKLNVD